VIRSARFSVRGKTMYPPVGPALTTLPFLSVAFNPSNRLD